ncbi:MAG: hypothetical protein IKO06_04225 [Alphaproteobacteria bacterium]|nr:hypothetical protein [Alphaproteobacteria bacterium]
MQKYDVSNFIIANALGELPTAENKIARRILIGGIVDGWNNNIYFQPKERLKINHYVPKRTEIM